MTGPASSAPLATVVQDPPANLRVFETDPQKDVRWESFVKAHPQGSVYHHPAWVAALEEEYGQTGVHLACEDASGQIQGILPMLRTRGLPLGLGGRQAGRRLSSLPRTPVAGPLCLNPQAAAALLGAAVAMASRDGAGQLQVKALGRELDGLADGLVCSPWRMNYVLELAAGPDGQVQIGKSHHRRASIKSTVNKATKLGVRVRAASSEEDLREWYGLYLDAMRRNAVPPRSYRFFAALRKFLEPRGMFQLLVAEHHQNGAGRMIAGSLFLMFGQTIFYAFNGARAEDLGLRPNDVIQWQAIHDAYRNSYRFFDFGEVAEDHSQLAIFKSKWGAEAVKMYRYYYPGAAVETSAPGAASPQTRLAKAVWRALPLKTTAWLGDVIFSYL